MLERVFDFREHSGFVDQLQRHQLPQKSLYRLAAVRDSVEKASTELPTDYGGHLKCALGRLREPVDARRDDTLDSVRHHDVLESLRQHPGVTDAPDTARLAKRLDHFFDKERVALGLAREQGLKIVGQTLGDEHRARHRDALL